METRVRLFSVFCICWACCPANLSLIWVERATSSHKWHFWGTVECPFPMWGWGCSVHHFIKKIFLITSVRLCAGFCIHGGHGVLWGFWRPRSIWPSGSKESAGLTAIKTSGSLARRSGSLWRRDEAEPSGSQWDRWQQHTHQLWFQREHHIRECHVWWRWEGFFVPGAKRDVDDVGKNHSCWTTCHVWVLEGGPLDRIPRNGSGASQPSFHWLLLQWNHHSHSLEAGMLQICLEMCMLFHTCHGRFLCFQVWQGSYKK